MKKETLGGILTLVLVVNLLMLCFCLGVVVQYARYDAESLNCLDMTLELYPLFKAVGCDTRIMYGCTNTAGHLWLRINDMDFECTELRFKDMSNEYDNIREWIKT